MSTENQEQPGTGSLDLSGMEFRRRRARVGPTDEQKYAGLWWQIALGIFVGLLGHSVVAGLYVRWEIYTGLKAMGIEAEKVEQDMQGAIDPLSQSMGRPAPSGRAQLQSMRPLAPGERCVGGKRFLKIPNGWAQVLEPCTQENE